MRLRAWLPAIVWHLLLIACIAAGPAFGQTGGRRVALVIGNSSYKSVDRLVNPANDAKLIASTLQAAGFTLVGDGAQLDLDKSHFDRAVQLFGKAVQGADVALFYYSGHGMQVNGVNWLVPVDANPTAQRDLDFQMVDANLVLRQLESAGTKLNLLILDACRNNPFVTRGIRASGGGLAEMQAPEGTLISYATQPGNVAGDGTTGNSPYTVALARAIRIPGADIFRVFNEVGLTVKQTTGGSQQPWLASSPISGNFFFFNSPVTITAAPPAPGPAQAPPPATAGSPFDGDWMVTIVCDPTPDALGYTWQFLARVTNGRLHGTYGVQGKPTSFTLDGPINAEGVGHLIGTGLTGDPSHNVGHTREGQSYSYPVTVRFTPTHGEGQRTAIRPCKLDFAKL